MGKNKDKKKQSDNKQEGEEEIINVEEDKQLFEDIFGVSIDEIKEEEDEEEKYEDILEDLNEIREKTTIEEKLEVKKIEPIEKFVVEPPIEDPAIKEAVHVLQQKVVMKPIISLPKIPPKTTSSKIFEPIKPIAPPPLKTPKINIAPPPKVRKITELPIKIIQTEMSHQTETAPIKPKEPVIPPIEKLTHVSGTPGVIKPISFQNTTMEEPINKPVKVIEPQAAFRTAKLFIDENEIQEKNEDKEELSDIRCGNCGTRITKKAEVSLKEGWIINCKACGNQIIHH